METGMKTGWVGLLTQTLPDLKNKHEPRQEWRKSEVKDLEGKGLIEKYAISNISDILRKRSLRKWGKSLPTVFIYPA